MPSLAPYPNLAYTHALAVPGVPCLTSSGAIILSDLLGEIKNSECTLVK